MMQDLRKDRGLQSPTLVSAKEVFVDLRRDVTQGLMQAHSIPLINYKWLTQTIDGERYFTDFGIAPRYNAKLYSGSGVKSNGVDQYVSIDTSLPESTGTFEFSFVYYGGTLKVLAGTVDVTDNNRAYIGLNQDGKLGVGIGDTSYTAEGQYIEEALVLGNFYRVKFTWDNGNWRLWIVGTITEISSYKAGWTVPQGGTSIFALYRADTQTFSNFSEAIINHVVGYNTIISDELSILCNNHPETYLYYEDNILKSKYLSQDEIDTVLFFLPMNEKDSYVRDLVNYTNVNENLGSPIFDAGNAVGTSSIDGLDISFSITTVGTQSFRPIIIWDFGNSILDAYYLVSFDLQVISGTVVFAGVKLNIGSGVGESYDWVDGTYTTGSYSFTGLIKANGTDGTFRIRSDNTVLQEASITNVKVSKLSGVYPISNPTVECRDDATQLPYGRQNALLKRDVLGVEYGLSNGMECDGIGYIVIPDHFDTVNIHVITTPYELSGSILSGGASLDTTGMTIDVESDVTLESQTIGDAITIGNGYKGNISTYTEVLL